MSIGILILGTFSEYGQSDCERNLQQFYFMQTSQDGLNLSHYHLCCTKENSLRYNHFSSAGFSSSMASSHHTYFPFFQVKGIKSVKTRTTQMELTTNENNCKVFHKLDSQSNIYGLIVCVFETVKCERLNLGDFLNYMFLKFCFIYAFQHCPQENDDLSFLPRHIRILFPIFTLKESSIQT